MESITLVYMRFSIHRHAMAAWNLGMCCLIMIATALLASGQQTDATTDKATIQALLMEVRQLRLALERSTSLVPRIQLAAQRLQAQQDRVDRLSKEVRDVRNSMAQQSTEKDRTAAIIKDVENQIGQTQDPAHRKELEGVLKQFPVELERLTARENQERAQEVELSSLLQTETAKLNALSDQFDAFDKKLQDGQQAYGPGANQR
jgi:hypothetical protein